MSDFYLLCHNRILNTTMDFYLRPEDGALLVDEPGRDIPFLVEPEAVQALLQTVQDTYVSTDVELNEDLEIVSYE